MPALGVGRPQAANRVHPAQATAAGQRSASVGVPGHLLDLQVMLRLPAAADARLRTWCDFVVQFAVAAKRFLLLECREMHGPRAVPSARRLTWWTSSIANAHVAKRSLPLECQEMHGALAAPSAKRQTWW